MKYLFVLSLIISFKLSTQSITPQEAKQHVGFIQTVCGIITDSHAGAKATFLNMGGKYPNQEFTIVIFADDRSKFNYDLTSLQGKNVCVSGIIKNYKGKPEIIVNKELQIKQ